MNLVEAIAVLNGNLPHPWDKNMDANHQQIATAWDKVMDVLLEYDYEKDCYEMMQKRWKAQVEVVRTRIDKGLLMDEDKRLLDELGIPYEFDKRIH